MRKRTVCIGLSVIFWSAILVANPATEQVGNKTINISYKDKTQAGQRVEQQLSLPANGAASISTGANAAQVQILDHSQPQRLLVRLKEQPQQPYLKQQRSQLAAAGKLSRTAVQQQLHKSSLSHQQLLQKSQRQIVGELRKQKLLLNVHRQFTQLTNSISITAAPNAIEQIRRLPQVAAVYPDNKVSALLAESVPVTEAPSLWAMQDAQGRSVTGRGVTVAILDTGIDYTHPDLGGCIGAGCKVAGGYNFIEGEDSANPMDKHGHGTHVAGIVAAKGVLTGMAPDAELYAYKVLSDGGWGMDSSIIAALEKAVDPDGDPLTDDQINIVNMSLGGQGAPDSPLSEAANNAMAAGVMVIVAAGNSGSNYSTIGSPGNAEQVLTVGATDNNGEIAYFSSRGPVSGQKYVKPEIVAPGVEINSTKPGNSYVRLSGTSMATPHVVGGAALLKQLHPELSAAELKMLLVNNSADLGNDVFTQGAGMMKLHAAATAKVLVSPSLLSAGSVNISEPNWASDLPIKVKNLSGENITVGLQVPERLPSGASATATPASQVLVAGQEAELHLGLMVDTQALPYADSATLHHEVIANLKVDDNLIRLPLVFAKAAKLNIQFAGAAPWILQVFNTDGSFIATSVFNSCTDIPADYAMDVKPGNYNVVTTFYTENCDVNATVFKEDIAVADTAAVVIDSAAAIHEISVGTVLDLNGDALSLDTMNVINKEFFWNVPDVAGNLYFLGGRTPSIMRVSDVSSRIQLEVSTYFGLPQAEPGKAGRYFLVDQTFTEGVSSQQLLDLDMRTAGSVEFNYNDADILANGVNLTVGASQIRSIVDFMAIGAYQTSYETYYQPIKATAYAAISTMENGEWYPDFGVNYLNSDPEIWNPMLMRTGPIAFQDTHSYTKLNGAFRSLDETNYRSETPELTVDSNAYFLAAQLNYFPQSRELSVQNISTRSTYSSGFSIARDFGQNNFFDDMSYREFCDEQLISEATTNGSGFNLIMADASCVQQVIEFTQATRFMGKSSTSVSRLLLDTQKISSADLYQLETPELHQVIFLNDGKASRLLNGDDLELQIKAQRSSINLALAPEQVSIEYRLTGDDNWLRLTPAQVGLSYFVKLPQVTGSHGLSLRITLANELGVTLEQTLNDVALIGAGAVSQIILPPRFETLSPLVVEAAGFDTNYSLPPVSAVDSTDGDLIATTMDLGPYSVGEHLIRWQAINSLGKKATAIQSLHVIDTTPPVISLPFDIRVTATGEFTQVELGQASAIDLVDGDVIPWAELSGPFTVGAHSVPWTAVDSHFNYVTAYQNVTIDPVPASSASSASSVATSSRASTGGSNSSGGGGGVIGGFMLWIFMFLGISTLYARRTAA
jgi:subtilisin family serine protease